MIPLNISNFNHLNNKTEGTGIISLDLLNDNDYHLITALKEIF